MVSKLAASEKKKLLHSMALKIHEFSVTYSVTHTNEEYIEFKDKFLSMEKIGDWIIIDKTNDNYLWMFHKCS